MSVCVISNWGCNRCQYASYQIGAAIDVSMDGVCSLLPTRERGRARARERAKERENERKERENERKRAGVPQLPVGL